MIGFSLAVVAFVAIFGMFGVIANRDAPGKGLSAAVAVVALIVMATIVVQTQSLPTK